MRTTRLRLVHMLAGVVIAVLLGIHMVVIHLDDILCFFGAGTTDPTSWQAMIGRASQGIWASLYIALLAFVLYHAFYGLRGIILEVTTSAKTGRIVTRVLMVVGIITFIWGSYVPIALLSS